MSYLNDFASGTSDTRRTYAPRHPSVVPDQRAQVSASLGRVWQYALDDNHLTHLAVVASRAETHEPGHTAVGDPTPSAVKARQAGTRVHKALAVHSTVRHRAVAVVGCRRNKFNVLSFMSILSSSIWNKAIASFRCTLNTLNALYTSAVFIRQVPQLFDQMQEKTNPERSCMISNDIQ